MERNKVRTITGMTPGSVMRDLIDNRDSDIYRNHYTGKVVNNNDPDKLGKCQIRVYGVFGSDIPDSDLPWALPDQTFVGSKVGNFIVPPVNAIVRVFFDNGDLYLPHYTSKVVDKNNMPSQKDIDYPDNMVLFETDEGDYLTVNRKSKETTYNHNSGTKILIKENGTIEINVVNDMTEEVQGKIEIQSQGTMHLKHTGNLTVDGTTVIPAAPGPLCALPNCVITGAPHTGNVCLP